jgi:hypothetical protein
MIIQLLGVALISLLTITPTIQQNNIEQLIAPNIEIQDNFFNHNTPNRIYVKNNFSYWFHSDNSPATVYYDFRLSTSFTTLQHWTSAQGLINGTYLEANITSNVYIIDDNFYVYDLSDTSVGNVTLMTGNVMRSLLRDYYFKTRGGNPTTESFSFTQTTANLVTTTSYYTYSLTGTQGTMSGRIYVASNNDSRFFTPTVANTTVTVPTGTNLEQLITNHLLYLLMFF